MKIVGGMGIKNSVTLMSDTYKATARLLPDGSIEGKWSERSGMENFFSSHRYIFPRVLVLFLHIFSGLSKRHLSVLVGSLLLFAFGTEILLRTYSSDPQASMETLNWWLRVCQPLVFLPFLWLIRKHVAGFHAAEHMALAAYERHGIRGLECVAQQPRVHSKCGGRLLAPMASTVLIASLVYPWLGNYTTLVSLGLFEVMLWVDLLIGFDNIAPTAAISKWLQWYITTKPATESEVRVGTEALRQLLLAHGEIAE